MSAGLVNDEPVIDGLVDALRRQGVTDVDDSALAKSLYASDASLYRIPPRVVVRPRDTDEVAAALEVARAFGVPLTMRGAGTSIAGNAVGAGILVDTSKHLNQVLALDREARTALVQPGVVHAGLQKLALPAGLRFGPDPSTHTRCTIGGMIGNNACGSRALGYGRTVDNVEALTVLLADGSVARLSPGGFEPSRNHINALHTLVDNHLELVRTEFGRFGRQVSGYSFEHLLPENGRRFDRFLVGTEGTLGVVLDATVRLVEDAPFRALAVLGYPTMADAADAVPALLEHPLVACEGLDQRIAGMVQRRPELPDGGGWLFAEVTAATEEEAQTVAAAVARTAGVPHRIVTDIPEQLALWRIREDGAGLAARSLSRPAQAGWEDAAVPPAKLGAYLRDFDALLKESALDGVPYGHFGDGCVHVRIDFELEDPAGRGRYRQFVESAADLVASYGGSMSGEHGDGRARSELLPRMYSPQAIALMQQAKRILDHDNLLNPGVLVEPAPFDSDLRLAAPQRPVRTTLRLTHDAGSFAGAVHRCTGVGKCIADNTGSGGVMCPSYVVSREEKDSTRGRARVLQDVVTGVLDFDDPAVDDALDLCLSCKGCARDCPTGIDMATYKSETLSQKYAGARGFLRRPRSHYALGQLPRWARMTPPRLANAMLRSKTVGWAAKSAAGVDQRRNLPRFSPRPLRSRGKPLAENVDVWIWADSFTDRFAADTGRAAVSLLEISWPARGSHPGARVLRTDLDHHGPAQRCASHRGPGRGDAARLRRERHPSHRPRTELPRIDPGGRRPAARRPPCRRGEFGDPVPGRVPGQPDRCGGVDAAGPDRCRGGRPAALPSPCGDRVGDRRGAAGEHRREGEAGRRLLRAGRQLRGGGGPLRDERGHRRARPAARRTCCRAGGRRTRRRVLLPHAARRPRRSPGAAPRRAAPRGRPPVGAREEGADIGGC